MIKSFLMLCLAVMAFVFLVKFEVLGAVSTPSATARIEVQKVIYDLPHAGILPDHPLYIFKATRDQLMDLMTRDQIKKAELYLLLSDKRMSMAILLTEKGKNGMAVSTLSKGEKYFLKIPDLLKTSKKQGASAPDDFVARVKMANIKHREVIEDLMKKTSSGERSGLTEILDLNLKINKDLQGL